MSQPHASHHHTHTPAQPQTRRVALVTGGSRGIGAATALTLARQGYDVALPLLARHSTITLVTSHRAHLYGQMEQLPAYEPVAASKYAGEQALRARQEEFAARDIRLLVVTGDLIEGTITPKLLERTAPGLLQQRRAPQGTLPTASEMGQQVAPATLNPALPTGSLVVVGAPLESMLPVQEE